MTARLENLGLAVAGIVAAGLVALLGLRLWDFIADRVAMSGLLARQVQEPAIFDPNMVADLPDPARRYFFYTITPGTPLWTVAQVRMAGELGLGPKGSPGYRPMRALQVLAPPYGFVWQVRAGIMSGTDASTPNASWSRFRLLGIMPVGRVARNDDHARSSFGRCVAEALFWAPAALLPGPGIRWEEAGPDTARVQVTRGDLFQEVDVRVAQNGQPLWVRFARWTNANDEKAYRLQPFGGELSRVRDFSGFRLPTRVEGGNFFGTEDYFAFFRADIRDIRFPENA